MGTSYGLLTGLDAVNKGYSPARVILDGVELSNVSVVNDVEGWVEIFATDSKGLIAAFKEGTDDEGNPVLGTRTYRLYGDVTYIPNAPNGL